jgi:putative ABC transport system permease protein
MTLHPILAALRKHKAGAVLIALQIALTLAIVCNAIFIIGQRIERVGRPTGLAENDLFLITQQWVGSFDMSSPADIDRLDAMQQEDLAALRAMPDIASVSSISTMPLLNETTDATVSLKPDQQETAASARTVLYSGDGVMLTTLGLKLVAGRDFNTDDIRHEAARDPHAAAVVIVTRALAENLFGPGDAIGKTIYFSGSSKPATIVGMVEQLQVSTTHGWASNFIGNSTLVPIRLDGNMSRYAVRAKPGRLEEAMKTVPPTLFKVNPLRVLKDRNLRSFADIRSEAYRSDLGMAMLMAVISLILLGVTAAGIVGLSSFWVAQRHRQIGMRRALGARKRDILCYFQIENLLIASGGAAVGAVLAVALNLWLIQHMAMARLPMGYVLAGVVVVLLLGQCSVFLPARRASNVPPVLAMRAA